MTMFGYIYEIRNDLNGHTYVGKHECSDGNDDYMGSGILLKPAYKKYGIQHFTKRIIQYSPTLEDLNRSEELWIDFYKGIGKGEYNIARGGQGGNTMMYASEEKKAERSRKLREANKGHNVSEETKLKISEANKGRPTWNKGKKMSKETRRKIAEYRTGRKHSEESIRKMSEAHKCHVTSEETRKKLSESHKGQEGYWKGKQGPNKGRKMSEETKRKISETRRRRNKEKSLCK